MSKVILIYLAILRIIGSFLIGVLILFGALAAFLSLSKILTDGFLK